MGTTQYDEGSKYYIRNCVICNKQTKNENLFCKECWTEARELRDDLYIDYNGEALKKGYYKVQKDCFQTSNIKELKEKILHLYSIADAYSIFNGKELLEKARTDIVEIVEKQIHEYDYEDDEDDYEDDDYDDEPGIEYDNESETCCVCGNHAPYGKQCKDCYYETLDYKDNIDKNRRANELREWYYNLKNSIFRQKDFELKQSNCNKLIALAILCRDIHGDDALISRVYNDIEGLLEHAPQQDKSKKQQTQDNDFDAHKNETTGEVKCIDGHWVENDLERDIDDMLYSLRKPHVYAKKVNEITARAVKSDWFIPVLSDTKGIYIELWGMDTEEYRKNKEAKIALYQEEELALIQIYRKDVLSDKALLRDNLESWINEKEKELKKRR